MAEYTPIPTDIVMSPLGRWVVTWSIAPWLRMDITLSSNPGDRDAIIAASRETLDVILAILREGVTT